MEFILVRVRKPTQEASCDIILWMAGIIYHDKITDIYYTDTHSTYNKQHKTSSELMLYNFS